MRARFINEMSISSIKIEDIINKQILDQWLSDSYLEETFKYQYAYEINQNPEDLEENIDEEDFEKWLKYELEVLAENTIDKFKYDIIKGNTISIWRIITVDKNWINLLETSKIKRLGIYWTWYKEAAEPHWGYDPDKIPILLESEIDINYIDWIETIKLNMNPIYEEEREIRLFKNTPIKLKFIEVNGDEIDISNIGNKIFKA